MSSRRWVVWFGLAGVFISLACNFSEQVAAAVTRAVVTGSPQLSMTSESYPQPGGGQPVDQGTATLTGTLVSGTLTVTITSPVTATNTLTVEATSTNNLLYPGPSQEPTLPAQTPTVTSSLGATSTQGSSPTPNQLTQTALVQPVATGTLTLAASPTWTITPTPTPTPTTTPTPIPPPPWVSSDLHATPPGLVKLASGNVQIIEFFAYWDGPSQAMAPLVHGLEPRYAGRVNFVYLDIDDPATGFLKKTLGYRAQPHFFVLDGAGNILDDWVGYATVDELITVIEGAL